MKDVIWKVHSCSESGNTMVGEYYLFCHFFPRILVKSIFLVSTSYVIIWSNIVFVFRIRVVLVASKMGLVYSVKKYPSKGSKVGVPNG